MHDLSGGFRHTSSSCDGYRAAAGAQTRIRKEILRFLLPSACAYLAALLIFKLFLMQPAENYVSTEIPSIENSPAYSLVTWICI